MISRSIRALPSLLASLALLTLSCAAPAELARRSEVALGKGDTRQAYTWAERAMRAKADLPRARAAMTAAAGQTVPDWQMRVRNLANVDTVGAARLSLEFGKVRAELGGWDIPMPLDSFYLDEERRIREGGAGALYARGIAQLRDHEARAAYGSFVAANEIVPSYRDVDDRIRRSFELGTVRIAILPFDDDTGVPGLAGEVAGWVRGQVSANMSPRKYPFVKFVPGDAIAAQVNGAGRMTRDEAIHLGRTLGAKRVVWGRLHGLHSDTRTDTWRDRVFRKTSARDSTGSWRTYYDEDFVETVSRERAVQVAWEFEVIDTDEEKSLAARDGTEEVTARAIFTGFSPRGNSSDYCLTPPDWKSARADECKDAESRWKSRYGDWSVAGYLEASHDKREFRYSRDDRDRFVNAGRPAVCNGLPPAGDLAFLALKDVASPVWDALRGLEAASKP